ncbi:hypothetical protein ELH39_01050 [Rhizobium ruizarguesonis]|uniref:sensor histidine kinase n=1 Tax=Rhizobium ruizarguesonis TaxID=2081791 RepID=UPI0010311A6A|nr:ATP-binding protein [Rhizobium ruizarguesonis]TBB95937.1 hypothetical protein ELH39_01050 [Rhizobium ruizarguesonis]
MAKFSVDTKLFRELGELLVGRDSTAMVELIKNAYDADARKVVVFGEGIKDGENGVIVIGDDGVGMTARIFERGFLTIAGRTKTESDLTSPVFHRRYTGEKGVGRLSAHKLAAHLTVSSRRWDGSPVDELTGFPSGEGVEAEIDWDQIEALETLEEIGTSTAVVVAAIARAGVAGTQLTMKRLRKSWTSRDVDMFFSDVATLIPSAPLVEQLPEALVVEKLAFATPKVRKSETADPGFFIDFTGDFADAGADLPAVADAAFWVIEILCDAESEQITIAVEPTRTALRHPKFKQAEGWKGTFPIEKGSDAVSFQARIFEKENETWPRSYQGVRVYLEGFRVPPYGDRNDDWLDLDREYRSRGAGELGRLKRFRDWEIPGGDPDEGLVIKGNANYFGAVFLTRDETSQLKMLVNREGFVPAKEWDFIYDVVRWAIGVQVRQRRLATNRAPPRVVVPPTARRNFATIDSPSAPAVLHTRSLHREAVEIAQEVRSLASSGDARAAGEKLTRLEEVVRQADAISTTEASEAIMFRVLASLGIEQAAFVHEIMGLGVVAETLSSRLERLSKSASDPNAAARLKELVADANELRERLRRNGVYLSEMTGVEGRRRRSRFRLADRMSAVIGFYKPAMDRRNVTVVNDVPASLLSPLLFPAEASAVFSNVVSNAVKFAGDPGLIRAWGFEDGDEVVIRVENSGVAVDLENADRLFDPFRSSTHEADASLGQGMGLGLTISRSLMDEYGGTIRFVTPSNNFSTAIEIRWPKR